MRRRAVRMSTRITVGPSRDMGEETSSSVPGEEHAHTHTCAHTHTHMCPHAQAHDHTHANTHAYARMHAHSYTHIHTHTHTCTAPQSTQSHLCHCFAFTEERFTCIPPLLSPSTAFRPLPSEVFRYRRSAQ